jgi:hypothetical protein
VHYEDREWHIMLECIFLEGRDNVIQMLMAMTNLNNVFFNIAIFHLTQMAIVLGG